MEAFFRCLRATESVNGTNLVDLRMINRGPLGEAGLSCIISLIAVIGQRVKWPKFGSGMVKADFLS